MREKVTLVVGTQAEINSVADRIVAIAKLGGRVPDPWPWAIYDGDDGPYIDGSLRSLQLLEVVEDLEKKGDKHEQTP